MDSLMLDSLKSEIIAVSKIVGKEINTNDIWICDSGCPHNSPKKRDSNVSNVYMFQYKDNFLKIGKADIKSSARHNSHHYTPKGSSSSLYHSLEKSDYFKSIISNGNIGKWIKENCRRIDIYINENESSYTLGMIESLMIYKFNPLFETKTERLKN